MRAREVSRPLAAVSFSAAGSRERGGGTSRACLKVARDPSDRLRRGSSQKRQYDYGLNNQERLLINENEEQRGRINR